MGDFLPQLLTVGIGLGVLGASYLVDLVAALANVFGTHTNDKFSFKKLGRGIAKALLWALAVVGFTVVINLLNWFTTRLGVDISNFLGDASTVGILGIISVASATYAKNAYDNIKYFLDKGDSSKNIDTSGVQPNYNGIVNDMKEFANKITPRWTQEDLQTNSEASKEAEQNVGQGSSVNPLTRRLPDGDNENGNGWQCSKYAYYLGTGIVMHYAPHPDYGPCNGNQMVDYLCNNYGFVRCGKIAGAIFSYNSGQYGHTGMVVDPANNIVNDANWTPLTVSTHYLNLEAVGAIYCCPPDMLPPEPTPTPEPAHHDDPNQFKVGDWVVVTNPVDIYGTPLAVSGSYQVMEISNGSVVIGRNGAITARMWAENLSKTSAPKPSETKFKVGDTVVPTRLVDYYGTPLYQWDPAYTITEIDGNRAVLSARGQIWAAMNTADLRKA